MTIFFVIFTPKILVRTHLGVTIFLTRHWKRAR